MSESELFCYGSALLVGLLLWVLTLGMPDRIGGSRRPPKHPPGWENAQRAKKRRPPKRKGDE